MVFIKTTDTNSVLWLVMRGDDIPVVLVDLDGTVCDSEWRKHLIPNWLEYSLACDGDEVIEPMAEYVQRLSLVFSVHFVTGRNIEAKDKTRTWLKEHEFLNYQGLAMRHTGDHRKNPVVKADVAVYLRSMGKKIAFAIDDHPGVAAEFAKLEIPTLLVGQNRPVVDASAWKRW